MNSDVLKMLMGIGEQYRKPVTDFATGGLHGLMKGQGIQTPEWSDTAASFLQNPDFNAALGNFKIGATPWGVTRAVAGRAGGGHGGPSVMSEYDPAKITRLKEMLDQGKTYKEIATEFDASRGAVAGIVNRLGYGKGGPVNNPYGQAGSPVKADEVLPPPKRAPSKPMTPSQQRPYIEDDAAYYQSLGDILK